MPDTIIASEAAISLLQRRRPGQRMPVTEETRPHDQVLAEAGLMIPLHAMTVGDNSAYRLTEAGVTYLAIDPASSATSPAPTR